MAVLKRAKAVRTAAVIEVMGMCSFSQQYLFNSMSVSDKLTSLIQAF